MCFCIIDLVIIYFSVLAVYPNSGGLWPEINSLQFLSSFSLPFYYFWYHCHSLHLNKTLLSLCFQLYLVLSYTLHFYITVSKCQHADGIVIIQMPLGCHCIATRYKSHSICDITNVFWFALPLHTPACQWLHLQLSEISNYHKQNIAFEYPISNSLCTFRIQHHISTGSWLIHTPLFKYSTSG